MTPTLKNDLLIRALKQEPVERVPVWMMRQAGRYLPEYMELRAKYTFWERCKTPELACEITVQPVRRLGVDAAILFSDILVVPEAMGMDITLKENVGPILDNPIRQVSDLQRLHIPDVQESLSYVTDAIHLIKKELDNSIPLIGFAGAPWTIFCYMVQGKGSKNFNEAKRFFYTQPEAAHQLLQMITDTTIAYLQEQIKAGVNAVQVFDSWGGLLEAEEYKVISYPYIRQIIHSIKNEVPSIVFAKGAWHSLGLLSQSGASALGIDWSVSASFARSIVGDTCTLQGNLDPTKLYGSPEYIEKETKKMLDSFGKQNYIANLGHGILPDIPVEHAQAFIETVQNYY